jgi:tRNA threonylcarbamoyladenosine biosynthesis protein TsaB
MIVLGFDTATPATVVGLRIADGTTLQRRDDPPTGRSRGTLASGEHPRFGQRPGHTTRLLGLASELLVQAQLRWGEIELIAVGVGPGTFTGLRIGVATARGLAQSLGVEVAGVCTLRVLAEAALGSAEALPGGSGATPQRSRAGADRDVLAAIDARRGEVFAAAYGADGELAPPRALPPQDLASVLPRAGADRGWLAVGDGAVRYRGHLEALAVAVPEDSSPLHRVDAGVLCELALSAPSGAPEAVLPDYRRRPDAEIALQRNASEVR